MLNNAHSFASIPEAEKYIRLLCHTPVIVDIESTPDGFSVVITEKKQLGVTVVEMHEDLGAAVNAALKAYAKELKALKREKKTVTQAIVEAEWLRVRQKKHSRMTWLSVN